MFADNGGTFMLNSGTLVVNGNTKTDDPSVPSNFYSEYTTGIWHVGTLDDNSDIRISGWTPTYGCVFGEYHNGSGEKHILSDDGSLWARVGGGYGDNLVWDDAEDETGQWTSSSSANTVFLSASNNATASNSANLIATASNDAAPAATNSDITATFSKNSIVESVTVHGVDKPANSYRLDFHASSGLWDEIPVPDTAAVFKPFTLKLYEIDGGTEKPVEDASLTIRFKVNPEKVKEHGVKAVRLGHLIGKSAWEKLEVTSLGETGGYHHFSVDAEEPTPYFAVAAVKAAPKSSGSSSEGTSVWATVTPTPTPVPTVTPTPTPAPTVTETPAAKTPMPVAGLLAGLGAAGVLFAVRMRR